MGSLGRSEDSGLSRLPHVGSLSLSGKQQRVRVGIDRVVYDPPYEADDSDGDESRVCVPAGQNGGYGGVQLLD
jgi:hypothetical protein